MRVLKGALIGMVSGFLVPVCFVSWVLGVSTKECFGGIFLWMVGSSGAILGTVVGMISALFISPQPNDNLGGTATGKLESVRATSAARPRRRRQLAVRWLGTAVF